MTYIVGYLPSSAAEGNIWSVNADDGNFTMAFSPPSYNPAGDIIGLPANQKLVEVGLVLEVISGQDTEIPVAIYEIIADNNKVVLHQSAIAVKASSGVGWRMLTATLNVDASSWEGKKLAVARTHPLDGQDNGVRYHDNDPPGGYYWAGVGAENFTFPDPWTSTEKDAAESLWAVFESNPSSGSVTGNLSVTEGNTAIAASGSLSVSSFVAISDQHDLTEAAASNSIAGSFSREEGIDPTLLVGQSELSGAVAVVEQKDSSVSAGEIGIIAASSTTKDSDELSAKGAVVSELTGTLSLTKQNDGISVSGFISITAALSTTEGGDNLNAKSGEEVTWFPNPLLTIYYRHADRSVRYRHKDRAVKYRI